MNSKKISLWILIYILFTINAFAEFDIDFKGMLGIRYAEPFATDKVDYAPSDIFDTDKLTFTVVDFNIKGKGRGNDLNLSFIRYYNNKINNDGVCGYSWTTNLDVNLQIVNDLYTISDEKGEQYVFQRYFQYPVGYRYRTVSKPNPHTLFTIPGYFLFKKKYGTTYYFNETTKLLERIVDLNGNQILYTRDALNRVTSIKDTSNRTITFTYNESNKIISASDPMNRTYTYGYDSNNNLINVTNPLNNVTTFEYTCPTDIHNISKVIKPKGNYQKYEYNQNDKLTKIYDNEIEIWNLTHNDDLGSVIIKNSIGLTVTKLTLNNGKKITTTDNFGTEADELDDNGYLAKYTDKLNHVTTMLRDAKGNVTSMTNARGYTTTQVYNTLNQVLQMTSPLNLIERFEYNYGKLIKYINGEGGAWVLTYNSSIFPLTVTDPNNKITTYEYNNNGDLIKITYPDTSTTEYTYDLCGNMLTYKDSTGNIYSYQYDALNRKIQVTNPDSTTKSITFDSNNFITSITDENLNTVSYTYNESDNLESFTDAESNVTQFEYDSQGRLISETDPKGFVYRYEYDVRNRLTKKIFPDNSFIKYEYAVQSNSKVSDAYGSRPVAMTDQMGNRGQIQYNELYARTSAINPAGYKTTRVWDGLDRVKEIIDENNRSTKFTYNNIYKLTSIENALGYKKLFNYDSMGNLSSFTDEESNTSRFYYNSFYQKSSETNALGKTVTYSRNANGYTTSITDPKNNAISYQYDSRNRVIKTTDSLNNQTQYFYDNTNNVIKLVRADNTEVLFEYYKTGLLKSVTYPDNQTVSFEYDENLNLTRMTDWTGESLYAYNNLNQLIEEIKPDGNKIQYQYNLNGVKTQLKLVDSNNIELYKIDYTIDNMNRVTKIADGNNTGVQFAYEPGGKRVSEIYSNGINTSYLYNTLNQLTQIKSVNSSQGILSKFDYTFDKAGNIKSETSESGLIKNYSYDAIYQLTGVNYSNAEYINYSFDDAGNRLTQNKNGVISNYSYNNLNQLTQLIESGIQTNYFYDLNGNLISETAPGKTVKYAYNFMNKVQSITKTGTENISLAMNYNGFGDRVSKTYSDGKSYGYIYNGNNVLAESSNQYLGNKAYYMTGGIDEIFARTINNAPEFYLIDNLNSLRKVVDGTHAIVNSIDYKPFGEVLSGNAGSHNYLYTGREKDFADIYYYRARTYSPLSGRFQQKDPIGAEGGLNLYRYCGNNSVNWVDPLGLDVTGFFNRPQGELTISDNDTGESVTVSAFSGHGTNTNNPASEGEKGKGPIPEGQYTIKEDSQNRDGWFELDANDSNPGNDIHDPTNRGQFRLHEGSISLGCITVVKGQEGWQEILDILKNTDRDLWDQIITGEYGELWVK